MPNNVKIERLAPADKDQLEAKYRDRPRPRLVRYPPAPSGLLEALNIAGQATVYLVVGADGNVKEVYLADCTSEHVAQAVALRLASTTFDPPAQECLFQIKYYAQPFNIQLSQGKNITMVRENILPERGPIAAQPAALTTIPASSIAVPPPPTASEIRRSEREHWKSAELPGIKVFSTASNRDSQRILHDLLLFCRALDTLRSADSASASTPVTLVLCAHYGEYAQFNLNGNPRSRSMSRPTAAEPTLVINLDIPMMDDAVAADAIAAALQRFYVQIFLMRMGGRLPPWLNQGLGKTLRGMVCTDDAIHFPALATDPTLKERRAGSADDLQAALKDGTFLSFDLLFAYVNHPRSHRASAFIPPEGARYAWLNLEPSGTWEDECYEFVHLCLFGAGGKYRQAFFQFAREAQANPPDETMFRNAFGVDYQTMLLELWRYAAVGSGIKIRLLNPDGSPLPPVPVVAFQPADPGEISRLKAQLTAQSGF